MSDPFKIDGPTCMMFSGGRSSALLLKRTLEANTLEALREWLVITFDNTGKEDEATLRFVDRCDKEWCAALGLRIVWLEYVAPASYAVVSFDTASRQGEPFEAVIAHRNGILPNKRAPFCSSELKTRTTHRYLKSIGWTEWTSFVGIRADEHGRVAKFRANPSPEIAAEEVALPLADAGVTKWDVAAFWIQQPFDLELANHNGNTPEGNCDLCFRKHPTRILSLIAQKPERAVWWAAQEKRAEQFATGDGCRFRNDRASYGEMLAFTRQQADAYGHGVPAEDDMSCFCGD